MNRTSSARAYSATEFATSQFQALPDDPEKRSILINIEYIELTVDFEVHESSLRVQNDSPIFDDTVGFRLNCFLRTHWALLLGRCVAVHEHVFLVIDIHCE